METILEILKYTLPSLIVMITAYLVLSSMLKNEKDKTEQQLRAMSRKELLPLRLQAYERLAVFLERTHPNNLVTRVNESGLTARDLQHMLIETIKTEFEHNLSQQIYVTQETWSTVRFVKDDSIKMVHLISASLPPNAPSSELARQILDYYLRSENGVPAQKGLDIINVEVKRLF